VQIQTVVSLRMFWRSTFDVQVHSNTHVLTGTKWLHSYFLRAGRDVVFHCATASPSASNASNQDLMYAVNVRGTEHVVAACKVSVRIVPIRSLMAASSGDGCRCTTAVALEPAHRVCEHHELLPEQAARVPKLVYTSSASVVFEGKDLEVNEDQPYASRPLDFYTRTKVSQLVRAQAISRQAVRGSLFCTQD
jgi:nucleoside-diphosphate-sugar epimerase